MKEFEFTLKFALPNLDDDPQSLLDSLFEAGCDDALVGIGKKGRIVLDFTRESNSAQAAIISACKQVQQAVPDAKLVEASPDLVGVSDIAEIMGCRRQNIQKLVSQRTKAFPIPVYESTQSLWHLAPVLEWYRTEQHKHVEPTLMDTANATLRINLAKENANFGQGIQEDLKTLFT